VKTQAADARWVDIPVRPSERSSSEDLSFVVASDTHAGIEAMTVEDQITGLAQASSLKTKPHFIAVTGDLTQSNKPDHFAAIGEAIAQTDVPYVPVPGNHDWYDGGLAYREYFGPPTYSFDVGAVHVAVLNDASPLETRLAFLDLDLSLINDDRQVVVMMHAPPRTDFRTELEKRDIDVLLTGHMHSNRVLLHSNFTEYNTQPLVMGGIDLTPGGYRVFRQEGRGELQVDHFNIVNKAAIALVSPAEQQVFAPCTAKVIVSAESFAQVASVTAVVEGLGEVSLSPKGGWVYSSDRLTTLCQAGSHEVDVVVTTSDGSTTNLNGSLVVGDTPSPQSVPDWPMYQGGATHLGASTWTGSFPDATLWSHEVGGIVHGGGVVLKDNRAFVSVSDYGSGLAGGVSAFHAGTGELLWQNAVGFSVSHAPAAAGDKVLFVSNDGTLHCVDAATGEGRWLYELAPGYPPVQRNLYSSPTILGDTVFAGGRHEFAALDVNTGEVLWTTEPFTEFGDLSSHASPAVAQGVVVVPFNRKGGLYAFDACLGTELWYAPWELTLGIHASPVIVDDTVYVINELMQLSALDLLTGEKRWTRTVESAAFGWGYLSSATPTAGDGQLFVATQRGALVAVDSNTGSTTWTHYGNTSLLRTTHYRGVSPAFSAAPTWTPGRLWVPGADGILRVLDTADGTLLWSVDLGVPLTTSLVVSATRLFVAGFDGSVRAMSAPP
jgi:VCBS repeat-containing protein